MAAGFNTDLKSGHVHDGPGEAQGKMFGFSQSNALAHLLPPFGELMTPEAREIAVWHTEQVFKTYCVTSSRTSSPVSPRLSPNSCPSLSSPDTPRHSGKGKMPAWGAEACARGTDRARLTRPGTRWHEAGEGIPTLDVPWEAGWPLLVRFRPGMTTNEQHLPPSSVITCMRGISGRRRQEHERLDMKSSSGICLSLCSVLQRHARHRALGSERANMPGTAPIRPVDAFLC